MTTIAEFLAALAADPKDETTRLVFADWLDERGDPRAAWMRDPDLTAWSLPGFVDPFVRLIAALPTKRTARRVLFRLGPAGVPALLGALAHNERRDDIRDLLDDQIDADPRLRALRPGLDAAGSAVEEVVALGREALALLPDLVARARGDRSSGDALSRFLAQPGVSSPPVFRYVWSAGGHDDRGIASDLFEAIVRYGPDPAGVQIILSGLNDHGGFAESATAALHELGLAVVPQLIASFAQADSDSFDWWVGALTQFGPDVVPLLLDALDREFATHGDRVGGSQIWMGLEKALREMAYEKQFGEHVPLVVARMTAIAAAAPGRIWYVVTPLQACGPAALPAWPLMEPYLTSPEPHYRSAALQFRAAIGEPQALGDAIAASLADDDAEGRLRAVWSLGTLLVTAPERGYEMLPRALQDTDRAVREAVLDLLTCPTFWDGPAPVLAALRQALADPDEKVRVKALGGLVRFPAAAGEALPDLLRLLRDDPCPEVRAYAAGLILSATPPARTPAVLAAILAALRDPDALVRSSAASVLIEWGTPLPPEAIAALIERLDEPNSAGENAAWALQRQPGPPPEVVAAFVARFHGDDLAVSARSLRVLHSLGHAFTEADLPALVRVFRARELWGFATARDILARLGTTPTE